MKKIRPSPARAEPVTDSTPSDSQYDSAPTSPAAGNVISHATAMRPATAQRTSAPGLPTPLPRIEPVATCVVERAMPAALELKMTAAEDASAAKPWGDSISTRPLPSVRMTRQPPM